MSRKEGQGPNRYDSQLSYALRPEVSFTDIRCSGPRLAEIPEFRLLGPVEATVGGRKIFLGGSKPRTVLAGLLLARGQVLSDNRLSELLWGDNPPKTLSAQIRTHISRIRKQLGNAAIIGRQGAGYVLHPGLAWIDGEEFARLAFRGRDAAAAGQLVTAARYLREALSLWRGPALIDTTEHLALSYQPSMEEARLAVLEDLFDAELALGRHARLIPELTELVAAHLLRERFRAQLMVALYRSERQADALSLYHEGRRLLADELGVDPGPMLQDAYQVILAGVGGWPAMRVPGR